MVPTGVGALAEAAQQAGTLAGVVDVGARVAIDEGPGEGAIDENGELARGRREGLGLADADSQPAVEGAEALPRVLLRRCCMDTGKSLISLILRFLP